MRTKPPAVASHPEAPMNPPGLRDASLPPQCALATGAFLPLLSAETASSDSAAEPSFGVMERTRSPR